MIAGPIPVPRHWSDPLYAWRDRLLSAPGFRAAAERFWPARWVARRRAAQLFDLCAGFVYSQVLLAGLRSGLFERLAGGPQPLQALAPQLGLDEAAAERLLRAAAALRLVQRRPLGRWGLGPLGAPLVGNEGLRAMVEHHGPLYRDLGDPLALLRRGRGGELGHYWPYAQAEDPRRLAPEAVAAYSQLMAASLPWVAQQLLAAYPVASHQRWLDVGGGEGAFAELLARAAPALQLTVFDLPAVVSRAEARFAAAGLSARCSAVGGSFLHEALPEGGFDALSLVRVLHDHDDAAVLALLQRCRAALAPGGRLIVLEPRAEGGAAMAEAYFGLYLWAMGSGRARGAAELTVLLQAAGFRQVQVLPTGMPLLAGLLIAVV